MTNAFNAFKTDTALEKSEGVWLDLGFMEIKVLRAGGKNEQFQRQLEEAFKPYQQAIAIKALPEDKAAEVLAKVYANCVILEWRTKQDDGSYLPTIEGEDGAPLAFTRDNVVAFLTALPNLFMTIRKEADDWQNFRASLRGLAAGN